MTQFAPLSKMGPIYTTPLSQIPRRAKSVSFLIKIIKIHKDQDLTKIIQIMEEIAPKSSKSPHFALNWSKSCPALTHYTSKYTKYKHK